MNNDLSEDQYNALVRDAMSWRKHCILVEKAETAIMDHRGHSYWEGYSDGKRDAEQISEGAIEVAADYDWRKEYQRAENAAPRAPTEHQRADATAVQASDDVLRADSAIAQPAVAATFAESYRNGYETAIETAAQLLEEQFKLWSVANKIRALKDAPRPHDV